MSSDPAAPPKPRGLAARLVIYGAAGVAGATAAWMVALPLQLYYAYYFVDRYSFDDPFRAQRASFRDHCAYYSPLDRPFWQFLVEGLPCLLCAGPLTGALFGLFTGCFGELWKKWGEVRCCTLLWAFAAAALPVGLMLAGEQTPVRTALTAPLYIIYGLTYGAVLGSCVRSLERWHPRRCVSRRSDNLPPL